MEEIVMVVVCVNDWVITGSTEELILSCKNDLKKSFDMIDIGLLQFCLGLEVWQMQDRIFVSQLNYTKNLLEKFKMTECQLMSIPIEPGLHKSRHDSSP